MAKQDSKLVKVASSIAAVLLTRETGGLCDTICETLTAQYDGAPVPEADGNFIADEVSRIRSWSPKAAEPRKSELRAIMSVYPLLTDAMKKLRDSKSNPKPVTFEAGVKLARSLRKGNTITQAVAAYIAGGKGNATKPEDRDLAASIKSCVTHVKRILEHKKLPAKFRASLASLCVEHDIAL